MVHRGWIGFVVAIFAFGLVAACNDYNYTIQTPTGSVLTFVAPSDATAGGPDFTLTVNASPANLAFDSTTVVMWNGHARTTKFVSGTQVTATITAADIASPGTVQIQTVTKQSGQGNNGLSNTLPFFVNPSSFPVPTITALNPNTMKFGGPDFPMTVTGTNFVQSPGNPVNSVVKWNANNLATTFVSSTQLTATVPAAMIASIGTATVTVVNPTPGGGPSNGVTFTITSMAPGGGGSGSAAAASLSANGRFVAFASAGESGRQEIFVRDTCQDAPAGCTPATTRVSVAADGSDANDSSGAPSISADGRFIAFESAATNLIAGGTHGTQVFLRDTCAGASTDCTPSTSQVSVDADGALGGNDNVSPSISASGRFIAFVSVTADHGMQKSSGGARSSFEQVFVRDTCLGAGKCTPRTVRISLHNGSDAGTSAPAISGDGRRVAVPSPAANVFTPSVRVEDRVFLALTKPKE
ncbi:MAG TPA: IPT/TIG domain-containing protein [Candidatus Acidoferrales bacterium]|nr:IPT/TIG domain-containing protein [Candidatus Acidoferrales bacterium]